MNYLAHAYLSFEHPEILTGNMISDFVKGRAQLSFNGNVLKGIILHRHIDEFTDRHPATARARQVFRPAYRLYSGAVVDVLYDHFLARDPDIFPGDSLKAFSTSTYAMMAKHQDLFPPRFLQMFQYMRRDDWLYHYRTHEGMRNSLEGLVRRALYLNDSETAYNLFLEHYVELQECYNAFFGDVKEFAKEKLETIL